MGYNTRAVKNRSPTTQITPQLLLQRELERRCQENPQYSLRAFARALQMSPTILSLVLNGKRPLSRNAALKLTGKLVLRQEDCQALLDWANTMPRLRGQSTELDGYQLSLDSFAMISDWYHYAILSLLEIEGSQFEAKWISRHLGITQIEAKGAMERLKRLEMVEQLEGRWRQATAPIRISNDVPTAATKRFQKQLMQKAINSIENDPDETRDFSSMTLAIDPAQIPYAREQIRKFRRRLTSELEAKVPAKRVYKLTVQIFPVSKEFVK